MPPSVRLATFSASGGDQRAGVAPPSPRFTDLSNGGVLDELTGLVWLKDIDCFGERTWALALGDANGLASGDCGLTDGSVAGDWRLPNLQELASLVDYGETDLALPLGHPFSNLPASNESTYWSSTTLTNNPSSAVTVFFCFGQMVAPFPPGLVERLPRPWAVTSAGAESPGCPPSFDSDSVSSVSMKPLLALALAASAVGCTSVDPGPAVTATAKLLEERGVSGVVWRPEGAEDSRISRDAEAIREILGRPLGPAEAGRLALLQSPDLQAALADLGVAQAALVQASRLSNPGLELSFLRGSGETKRTTGLAADVVDWLTQPLRRHLGEAELERTKLQVAATLFDGVAAAQLALIELQAAEAVATAFENREVGAQVAAEYAHALHAAGNLTLRDRTLVQAAWAEARTDSVARREERDRARERLRRLLGLSAGDEWTLAPLVRPAPALPELDPAELQEQALRDRLDLAAAGWAVDALERARKLHRATRWLPVGVEVGVERETEGGVRLTGPTVELALPIFDSGSAIKARYEAEIARSRAQRASLENRVRSEVREALAATASAAARSHILENDLVPARRRALELAVRESHQMLVGVFELLDAKDQLLEAEIGLLEATADAWRARIELLRALGRTIDGPAPATGQEEAEDDHAS